MNPIRHIRCEIFRVTQDEFAEILETSQATISRWEAGITNPSLRHLRRLRAEAIQRKLKWDDQLLFSAGGRAA